MTNDIRNLLTGSQVEAIKEMETGKLLSFLEKNYPEWYSYGFHLEYPNWRSLFLKDHVGFPFAANSEYQGEKFRPGQKILIKTEDDQGVITPNTKHWLGKKVTIMGCYLDLFDEGLTEQEYFIKECPRWFWKESYLEDCSPKEARKPLPEL